MDIGKGEDNTCLQHFRGFEIHFALKYCDSSDANSDVCHCYLKTVPI